MQQPAETTTPAPPGSGDPVRRTLGWLAGLAITTAAGWGLWFLAWRAVKKFKLVDDPEQAWPTLLGAAAAVSFVLFLLLERNFWLSRLSGLTVYPNAWRLVSALEYLVLGPLGLFARTAVGSPPKVKDKAKKPAAGHGHVREGVETVVFVVVLVFLLKQFVVEAFVIPTGSMAETLYGHHKMIACPECGHEFSLNASDEVDPSGGRPKRPIEGYCCPNCRFRTPFTAENLPPGNASGDRVLVHKAMQHRDPPKPGDVVVFKFPVSPQINFSAQNYIKRMWGVGGDTIAIWRGDLYVCKTLTHPVPADARPADLWHRHYMNENAEEALKKFDESRKAGFPAGAGGFELVRKSDELALAMRRLVYDNDRQSPTLTRAGVPPRWKAETDDWAADDPAAAKAFTHSGPGLGWLRYRHLPVADWPAPGAKAAAVEPRPVDNFLGYNAETTPAGDFKLDQGGEDYRYWVGDLMLECRATFSDPAAEVTLELSKGPNRYQAKFAGGAVTLTRTGPGGKELGTWPTPITKAGRYDLRFANIDCRLRVWVDDAPIPLGPEADYAPAVPDSFDPADEKKEGWTKANDAAAPASVGATGGVEVRKLKVWRDSYFINTRYAHTSDATAAVHTYYVQPGHYLCLGDNSAQSSDGRDWGAVPERLMLGRAVFVFAPLLDPNWLLKPRLDRVGFIK